MALLSALAEMGFRFRMDLPDEAMDLTALIFRNSAPTREEDVSDSLKIGIHVYYMPGIII